MSVIATDNNSLTTPYPQSQAGNERFKLWKKKAYVTYLYVPSGQSLPVKSHCFFSCWAEAVWQHNTLEVAGAGWERRRADLGTHGLRCMLCMRDSRGGERGMRGLQWSANF